MPNTETEPKPEFTREQIRIFGKQIGAAPSTITGWQQSAPPENILGMMRLLNRLSTLIIAQAEMLVEAEKTIAELETTIKTLRRLD